MLDGKTEARCDRVGEFVRRCGARRLGPKMQRGTMRLGFEHETEIARGRTQRVESALGKLNGGLAEGPPPRIPPIVAVRPRAGDPIDRAMAAKVVEITGSGANKGGAVRAFMAMPPFAGATPMFVGDDLTDEDGMIACNEAGGFGVLVGDRSPTSARFRLPDVPAVYQWLNL